jgi:hypothetical protein
MNEEIGQAGVAGRGRGCSNQSIVWLPFEFVLDPTVRDSADGMDGVIIIIYR